MRTESFAGKPLSALDAIRSLEGAIIGVYDLINLIEVAELALDKTVEPSPERIALNKIFAQSSKVNEMLGKDMPNPDA